MREIFPIIAPFDKLLEKQSFTPSTENPYRPISFCITEVLPEGILLFNNMTKAMVLLSKEEAERISIGKSPLPELVEKWFYVPKDHDDKKLCSQMRAVARMLLPKTKEITKFTIFTTTDCNARCFYCFEKEAKRINMSPLVAKKTSNFIASHCGGKKVSLSWFGGEPLYNKEAIDIICHSLKESGVVFHSSMITNGYLFDDETIRTAKEDWLLKKVQITLDGTEEVYNKAKAFIYKGENAFRKVIGNIGLLLDAGIQVSIRLNIDSYNAEDLSILTDYLVNRFKGSKGLGIYTHPLYGDSVHFAVDDPAKRKIVYRKIEEIQRVLEEAGFGQSYRFCRFVKTNQCMADSDTTLTVLPSGQLGKCEHFTDKFFVGHLNGNGILDRNELAAFKEEYPEIEECNNCPLYPDCLRLVRCEDNHLCFTELREDWLRQIRAGMRAAFYSRIELPLEESIADEQTIC